MLSREATNTNCKICGLSRLGLEPMIYRTRGEHANHYTTDTVFISGLQYELDFVLISVIHFKLRKLLLLLLLLLFTTFFKCCLVFDFLCVILLTFGCPFAFFPFLTLYCPSVELWLLIPTITLFIRILHFRKYD